MRPHLRVIPGGRESQESPPATGNHPAHAHARDRDRLRLAGQAVHALAQHWQTIRVHKDGSITVTFDKRAALAVRFLLSWKAPQ